MAEVILNLPLQRSGIKSRYHDLFLSVSDGKPYKIKRTEFADRNPHTLRVCIQAWARHRKLVAKTRVDEDGAVCVQMEPLV